MKRHRVFALVLFLCVLIPASAAAQISGISSPSGFSGKETLVTFQGASSTRVSTVNGVTLSYGSSTDIGCSGDPSARPFGPQEITSCDTATPFNGQPITMAFASPMNRFALELRHNLCNAQATLQFYRGQTSVGTAQTVPSQPMQPGNVCGPSAFSFNGYQSVQPFDRIVLAGPGNGYLKIDNLRFESTAPPPPVITTLPNPSSFSATATLITFQGVQNITTTVSGATFSRGGSSGVRCGMFSDPRPFGPQDPMGCDNDQPFTGAPINISLAANVTRIAFEAAFNGCGATATIEFFNGGTVVGTAQQSAAAPARPDGGCSPAGWIFAGFQTTTPFNRIRITGPGNGYVRIDNVRFE